MDTNTVVVKPAAGPRKVTRCEAKREGHRCKWRKGHEGHHRAFGRDWP